MLSSSVFIIYSVYGLFVPFVGPERTTGEASSAYVMNLKAVLAWLVRNR